MSYDNWQKYSLDDVCTRVTDGSHYSPKETGGNYPMLSVKDMRENGFDYSSCKMIDEIQYRKLLESDCVPQVNDVLVAKDGSYMKHVFVTKLFKEEAILSSIAILRPDLDKILPDFLKYYFLNPPMKNNIKENYVSGSAVPRIVLKDFKKMTLYIPKLKEQKAIANILSSFDDKIELNNKINKNLEEIAQVLYKHWFVDFEFPNEDGEPYQSSGGEMIESELGLIPKGWYVDTLGNNIDQLEAGKRPKGGVGKLDSGIPSVGAENVLGLGIYNYGNEKYISNEFFNTLKKGVVKNGDVMIYKDGAKLGRISYFDSDFPHEVCSINSHVFRVVTKPTLSQMYLYFWLDYPVNNNSLVNLNSSSAQPGINQTKLKSLKMIIPEKEAINTFTKITISLVEKILLNAKESKRLSEIRDTLLPKLMSGQFEVPIEG